MLKVGLDIGFGYTKILTDAGFKQCFPSLAKPVDAIKSETMLTNREDYYCVINGKPWEIGYLALREKQSASRAFSDADRFYNEAFAAMLATSLAAANPTGEAIRLVTGVPLSSFLAGHHEFDEFLISFSAIVRLNGREHSVRIEKAHIFPQSAGAFYNPKISAAIRPTLEHHALVSVIDIGYRTTDIATFEYEKTGIDEGKIIFLKDHSFTVDQGMVSVFRQLSRAIAADLGVFEVSFEDTEEVYRIGSMKTPDSTIDYSEKCCEVTKNVVSGLLDVYRVKKPSGSKAPTIIFTGGGSLAMHDELKKAFPNAIFAEEAQFGNALGFLEIATIFARTDLVG